MRVDAGKTGNGNVDQEENFGRDIRFLRWRGGASPVVTGHSVDFINELAEDNSYEWEWHACCDSSYGANENKYPVEPCGIRVKEEMEEAEEGLNRGPRGHADRHGTYKECSTADEEVSLAERFHEAVRGHLHKGS